MLGSFSPAVDVGWPRARGSDERPWAMYLLILGLSACVQVSFLRKQGWYWESLALKK